jgi:hypothetical protein
MDEEAFPSLLLDLTAHLETSIAVPEVSHRDMRALVGKRTRRYGTEPTTATGNQGDSVVQVHGYYLPVDHVMKSGLPANCGWRAPREIKSACGPS